MLGIPKRFVKNALRIFGLPDNEELLVFQKSDSKEFYDSHWAWLLRQLLLRFDLVRVSNDLEIVNNAFFKEESALHRQDWKQVFARMKEMETEENCVNDSAEMCVLWVAYQVRKNNTANVDLAKIDEALPPLTDKKKMDTVVNKCRNVMAFCLNRLENLTTQDLAIALINWYDEVFSSKKADEQKKNIRIRRNAVLIFLERAWRKQLERKNDSNVSTSVATTSSAEQKLIPLLITLTNRVLVDALSEAKDSAWSNISRNQLRLYFALLIGVFLN